MPLQRAIFERFPIISNAPSHRARMRHKCRAPSLSCLVTSAATHCSAPPRLLTRCDGCSTGDGGCLLDPGMAATVGKINHKPNCHPHNQPNPRIRREIFH